MDRAHPRGCAAGHGPHRTNACQARLRPLRQPTQLRPSRPLSCQQHAQSECGCHLPVALPRGGGSADVGLWVSAPTEPSGAEEAAEPNLERAGVKQMLSSFWEAGNDRHAVTPR